MPQKEIPIAVQYLGTLSFLQRLASIVRQKSSSICDKRSSLKTIRKQCKKGIGGQRETGAGVVRALTASRDDVALK